MSTIGQNNETEDEIKARNERGAKSRIDILLKLIDMGVFNYNDAAIRMGLSVDEFKKKAKEFGLL